VTYVIGSECIGSRDTSCVSVCPVDCIYETERMLVIHPDECIDCGACVPQCPVEAILRGDEADEDALPFVEINAAIADGKDSAERLIDQWIASHS
jgi:ferredoxin